MFGNGKKTIGVFVTQVHQEFQDTLGRGICSRAEELDYNVVFFSNFLGYGEFKYEIGEMNMARLPRYENLDGIILLPDTMFVEGFEKKIRENIGKYSSCPVVSVRQRIDEYNNVLIDDNSVLDDIIHHFIKDHGFSKINMLTGPEDNPVSIQRLDSYKRILKEYNLPVENDRIYFGDFWKLAAYDAVKLWLSDPDRIPEAIICGNDFMAISVCNALTSRGYRVPNDMAVSGCDNIVIAEDFSPSMTTVAMPVFEMGIEAVNKIHKQNEGIAQKKDSYLKSLSHFRESCGCHRRGDPFDVIGRRNLIINEVEAKDKAISNNAYMSIDLTGVSVLDALDKKLSSYTYLNDGFSSFYMCLNKGWDVYINEDDTDPSVITDEIVMEVGIKNGEWLQKVEFDKNEMLPPAYMDGTPQFFYFNMLHHQEKCYGYTAISFHEKQAYKPSYQGWLINVCNALENIKTHSEMNRLLYKLEDMSIKDEMTGLCNRRALNELGQKYLMQSREKKIRLMAFSADMDNLKYINDNFGHANGDIAIKVVADALMAASKDDELCIRMGGDEFTVIGLEYNDMKLKRFVKAFDDFIRKFNTDGIYGFPVKVSYGYSITMPNEHTELEDCISIADSRMYQQKYEKESMRLKRLEQKADLDRN